jgi:AcrR family transcriptional regulator
MGAMSTRRGVRTPSQDVERALLDAAEEVLVAEGIAGVTVRAVAERAGVAPMGVYNRYGGKDGLVDALVMRSFDLLTEALAVRQADPLERLRASGLAYRDFALSHPQHYAIIFMNAAGHRAAENPEVGEHAKASFDALVGHVVACLDAGAIAAGDPVDLAQQIWSTVHGAVALELGGMVLTEDPAATYQHLLDLLAAGLTARP